MYFAAAREGLMAPPFEFTEVQANDILDMQLRQLTRLSRIDLESELADGGWALEELNARSYPWAVARLADSGSASAAVSSGSDGPQRQRQ